MNRLNASAVCQRLTLLLVVSSAACGQSEPPKNGETTTPTPSPVAPTTVSPSPLTSADELPTDTVSTSTTEPSDWVCVVQPFAKSIDIAEASGAVVLDSGKIMVVGDSGTNGSYLLLDAETGDELESGRLPLDRRVSDDLEGLAQMDGHIFAITSSGWIQEWDRTKSGFRTQQKSYALAPWDKRELVCRSAKDSNCAQNYEGLCLLRSSPAKGECAGFAAAKATGRLLCLTYDENGNSGRRLQIDPSRVLQVAGSRTLSGCDFDKQGRLWFGNNFFAANSIGYIENW
ncbi:MAG: hypothetical protein JKY56_04125, partial [Kofleriaceae bacterium]|nr:hypothetical protein [Kofleriaceae bacterium]